MVRVLEEAGCIHTAFWRYVGLVYLRTVGPLRPQMMVSVWLHSSGLSIDSQAMLELREIEGGGSGSELDETIWDRVAELAWSRASLAEWNQQLSDQERGRLAQRWPSRAGKSPWTENQLARVPPMEDWAAVYVQARTSEWLQEKAVVRWLPSGDPWIPQMPTRPLAHWEDIVLQSRSPTLPTQWVEVLDAAVQEGHLKTGDMRQAVHAWKAAIDVLHRFRQRMQWPESMMAIPDWTVVDADWVLQAVLWLPIFAVKVASSRRLQALARLYVSLCFHDQCRGWYVRRDNQAHNQFVYTWMRTQFPTILKKKTDYGVQSSVAADVPPPHPQTPISSAIDENAQAENAGPQRDSKRRRLEASV